MGSAQRQGTWLRRHAVVVDVGLTLFAMLVGLLSHWDSADLRPDNAIGVERTATPFSAAVATAAVLPLLLRRRNPFVTALGLGTASATLGLTGHVASGVAIATLIAVYTVGAYGGLRSGSVMLVGVTGASTVALATSHRLLEDIQRSFFGWLLLLNVIGTVGAWAIGRAVQSHRAYLAELEERATRLERTRTAEVRVALAEERSRMARELHDVVAHHVSVMTVQAAAARRTLARSTERSVEAMLAVEETGRSALGEMRRIVGALRAADFNHSGDSADADPADLPLAPQLGVADLESLIDRSREAGLRVELTTVGAPLVLATGVDLAIYRVVQEALTNVLKHAGPTRAGVMLRFGDDSMSVRVTDEGNTNGRAPQPETDGDVPIGHGLVGMRERVSLNGGTLRTGHRLRGGFEVLARFPVKEATR